MTKRSIGHGTAHVTDGSRPPQLAVRRLGALPPRRMGRRSPRKERMTALDQDTTASTAPAHNEVRVMTLLVWVTTTAIFCQAILAGMFVSQDGRDGWITAHGVVADASWVLTLISAAYAYFRLQHHFPVLWRA